MALPELRFGRIVSCSGFVRDRIAVHRGACPPRPAAPAREFMLTEKIQRSGRLVHANLRQVPIVPGLTYGLLTVIRQVAKHPVTGERRVECACACGQVVDVVFHAIVSGNTKSCGCWRRQITGELSRKHGHCSRLKPTRVWMCWRNMLSRCLNTKNREYNNYGGRGITVCDSWRDSFAAFLADMGDCPTARHTIERIDNNASYCKENCKWATPAEQNRNKRTNHFLSLNGVTRTLVDWAAIIGIRHATLRERLENGWTIEQALTRAPVRNRRRDTKGKYEVETH